VSTVAPAIVHATCTPVAGADATIYLVQTADGWRANYEATILEDRTGGLPLICDEELTIDRHEERLSLATSLMHRPEYKRVSTRARAPADGGRVLCLHASHGVGCRQELLNFLGAEGHGGDVLGEARLDFLGGVGGHTSAIDAEGAEGAQVLDFFALGAEFDLVGLLVLPKSVDGEGVERDGSEGLDERVEGEAVAAQGGRLQFAALGVGQVDFDGRGEGVDLGPG
jgi:hypothetical protein